MSFDPEKVKRYDTGCGQSEYWVEEAPEGEWVKHSDYAQLMTLLHDVSSDADPAGTVRRLKVAEETCDALEKQVQELILELQKCKAVRDAFRKSGDDWRRAAMDRRARIAELEAELKEERK